MNIERCDRCGMELSTGRRRRNVNEWRLCLLCKGDIDQRLDRLTVLEGFVEEVEKMARPINGRR